MDYYGEISNFSYIIEFINAESTTIKNASKYKQILNNIIDSVSTTANINLTNKMFDEQLKLNNNINFNYLVDKFEI